MVREPAIQHYSAVLCRSCRQPVPVPAIIVGRTSDDPGRVFTLRCSACDKEKPYSVADIVELDGVPRPRVSRRQRATRSNEGTGLARAAHL